MTGRVGTEPVTQATGEPARRGATDARRPFRGTGDGSQGPFRGTGDGHTKTRLLATGDAPATGLLER